MLAVIFAEVGEILDEIVDDVVVGGAEKTPHLGLEAKLGLELIKEGSVEADEFVEESFVGERGLLMVLKRRFNLPHNGVAII